MIVNVSWSDLKGYATENSLDIKYVDLPSQYVLLCVYEDPFQFTTTITKTSPAGSDQTDFETNFKSTAIES